MHCEAWTVGQWAGLLADRPWSTVISEASKSVRRRSGRRRRRFGTGAGINCESNGLLAVPRMTRGDGAPSGQRRRADFPRCGAGAGEQTCPL